MVQGPIIVNLDSTHLSSAHPYWAADFDSTTIKLPSPAKLSLFLLQKKGHSSKKALEGQEARVLLCYCTNLMPCLPCKPQDKGLIGNDRSIRLERTRPSAASIVGKDGARRRIAIRTASGWRTMSIYVQWRTSGSATCVIPQIASVCSNSTINAQHRVSTAALPTLFPYSCNLLFCKTRHSTTESGNRLNTGKN